MNTPASSTAESPKKRGWLVVLALVVLLLLATPWILAKSTLRDRLLNAIVNSDDVSVTSTDASFGYFSPLSLSGLQIRSKDDTARIEVNQIKASHSWLGLLLSRPELGTFRFDKPSVNLLLDPQRSKSDSAQALKSEPTAEQQTVTLPNLAAEIRDASVLVRTPESSEPPIDLSNINLTLRVQQEAFGPVLRMEPTTVFDHAEITPALCGQGLQLIAPLLADEVAAQGAFSLRLAKFEVPVGGDPETRRQGTQIEGELQLHEASVTLRNTVAKQVSDVILNLLGKGLPERLTVAKDLVVDFEVNDGRIHHEGLALLLPRGDSSVELISSGSVGLDESLDLQVAVKLPDSLLGGGELVRSVTEAPILLAVTGTMEQPQVQLSKETGGLVGSIRGMIEGEPPSDEDADAVGEAISGAVDVVGGILGGLRERSRQRREKAAEAAEADSTDTPVAEETGEEETSQRPGLRERLRNRPRLFNRGRAPTDEASPSPPSPSPPSPSPPSPSPPSPSPPGEPIDL
jgi:hypothetical protein